MSVMEEFEHRVEAHRGEPFNDNEPESLYWIQHHEAALIVAALSRSSHQPGFSGKIQDLYRQTMIKVAEQWNRYDRAEEKVKTGGQ